MKQKVIQALALVIVCIYASVVISCATTANYEKVLNSWVGSDVNNLLTTWGPPSDVYEMPNGSKMYTWLWVDNTRVISNYNSYLNMVTSRTVTYWCKTTFTVNSSSVITNWRWEGNNCRT